MTHTRKIVAFMIAPLTPMLCLFVAFAFQDLNTGSGLMLYPSLLLFVLIPSYLSLTFVGLPSIWILRAFGVLNAWTLGLAGSVFGTASIFIFFRGLGFETLADFGRAHVLMGAGSGLMVSLSYWFLSGGKRGESEEVNSGAAA